MGGTLLGAGTALLGMSSPAAMQQARAQTMNAPLTGLGVDWTGPGGLGDYRNSNGNTADVVNAAHAGIRNREFAKAVRSAVDTGERPDLVVVGCGTSGMSACWHYRIERPNNTVLMLDNHPIFGGHAKQNEFEVDGYHLTAPQGATGLVLPLAKAEGLGLGAGGYLERLGLPTEYTFQKPQGLHRDILVPEDCWTPMHIGWERADVGYYYEGKGWVRNQWNTGFHGAPISEAAKRALLQLENYRAPPRREDWRQWLDGMTYERFLIDVVGLDTAAMPDVMSYLAPLTAAMGCGLGPDAVSAYAAFNLVQPGVVAYWRQEFNGEDTVAGNYLATFPGGHAGTNRHFLKKILPAAIKGGVTTNEIINGAVQWDQLDRANEPVRMRLGATVVAIAHDGNPPSARGVWVTYYKDGKCHKLLAKSVVLCTQQHVNRNVCQDVSPEYREAMASFHHAPMHVVNVAVRNWKFLEKLGIASARWFGGFGWWLSLRRNLEIPGQVTQPLDPSKPTVLTLYNPNPLPGVPYPQQATAARMQVYGRSFADIEASVRDQFTRMFGDHGFDANRDIAGIISNRWGHAYAIDPPGFFFGKDGKPSPMAVLRKPFGRIAFGHSELSGTQGWETAAAQGDRAGKQMAELT